MALNAVTALDVIPPEECAKLLKEGNFSSWAAYLYKTSSADLKPIFTYIITAYRAGVNLMGLDLDQVVITILEDLGGYDPTSSTKTTLINLLVQTNIISTETQTALLALI